MRPRIARGIVLAGLALSPILLGLGLAWVSNRYESAAGWSGFVGVLLLGGLLLVLGWLSLKADRELALPSGLAWILGGAALLRLAAGVFWFIALPAWGYNSPVEQAGYVMADAEARDRAAWDLSASGQPAWTAFRDFRFSDQYGGLLFLSAVVYTSLGGDQHQPLLMVVLAASFSALGVSFTWAFAKRAWDAKVAWLAAGFLAIYPEAVLLGSSQMREAFTITLAVMAFYGLVRFRQDHSWTGLGWVAGGLVACLFFSPPFAVLLMGMLALQAVMLGGWRSLRQHRLWLVLFGLAMVSGIGLWLTWGRFAPEGISNPIELAGWWLKQSAKWQAVLVRRASGWIQRLFKTLPEGLHLPFLLAYGVMQPFLPAALLDSSIPLWRGIAIWRALGWTILLIFLVVASIRAWDKHARGGLASGLSLVVWWGILLASWRSGGDVWDNPRYRVAFAGLQVALAAWAWMEQQRRPDPWLRRIAVGVGLLLAWFIPWYLRRYTEIGWMVVDLFKTIGLGVTSAILYGLWDWARSRGVGEQGSRGEEE